MKAKCAESGWHPDGLLAWRYIGGNWELWKCRLCGAVTDRNIFEPINEYIVHGDSEAAERCMDRWARRHRR
jgi:hypothetical protein